MQKFMHLNKRQKEAVEHGQGPLLMSAGAGSGKTRALTSRLNHLVSEKGINPERILAITFTNKAADEMRARVFGKNSPRPKGSELPLKNSAFIGTFHSLGLRILKQEVASLQRTLNLSIYDNDKSLSLIKKILKDLDISKEKLQPRLAFFVIGKYKNELRDPKQLLESEEAKDRLIHKVFSRYEESLQKNNAFDFDDLIEKPVRLLQKEAELLQKYQKLFDYVLVDEYQDINNAQYQLVRLLAEKHQNLNVVGDDQQAIYAFRGADFRNFLNFQKDWPKAKIVKLEQSYRSTKKIIASANQLIKHNVVQNLKDLWTDNAEGQSIQVVSSKSADQEAMWLASEVLSLIKKEPKASIAILYRTNAQSRAIEQILLSYNLGYKIYGGPRFYDRKEIKDLLAALSLAHNPIDTISLDRLEKSIGKRRSAKYLESLDQKRERSALESLNHFLSLSQYSTLLQNKFQNAAERIENIAELASFASSFNSLAEFLDQVLLLQSSDDESKDLSKNIPSSLRLMTIHIAKGLEFDYIFLVGVNDGLLPHQKSYLEPEGLEEERRLMYVAMTRAKKRLYLSYYAYPSRFLYELPQKHCEFISSDGSELWLPDEEDMYIES